MQLFFEKDRWETAIAKCCDKRMNKNTLMALCSPTSRISIYKSIRQNRYHIFPPRPKKIPKDDGTYRTVYVNDEIDRIILAIYNDMMFELCPQIIHPNCKSYRKHINCGKIVKHIAYRIHQLSYNDIGIKLDLSKYFDSVKIEYINQIFDKIDAQFGQSELTTLIREYYNNNLIYTETGELIEKFTSLKQGCPFSAFLADSILYDIDDTISKYDVTYIRYCDDIIIIGNEWKQAYQKLTELLTQKSLIVHPNKTEQLYKNQWFKFLGFMIHDDIITLSPSKITKLNKTIKNLTIRRNASIESITKNVNQYLYGKQDDKCWATAFLPVINNPKDIAVINSFIMDAIRASQTGKTKIGKLSSNHYSHNQFITRSLGANVKTNKEKIPIIPSYLPIGQMKHLMKHDYETYQITIQERISSYGQH